MPRDPISNHQRTRTALVVALVGVFGAGVLGGWSGAFSASGSASGNEFEIDDPARERDVDLARETAAQIEARGIRAMQDGDWERAQRAFEQLIERRPENFVGYYNLSSALCRQGKVEDAIDAIEQALLIGFSDKRQLQRDPDLAPMRETRFFRELMEGWGTIIESRHLADLARMNKLVRARKMEHRTLEDLRLEIVSAHDPVSTDQAVAELKLITRWAEREVFGGLGRSLGMGGGNDSTWVMVGLPEKRGFGRWAVETFGPSVRNGISSVGGAYEHQQRRLVAQDLGATLRHEYVHVLHWRDMSRMGQVHAPWVQEGLASVVEDFDIVNGHLIPMASWRTNMVKRMLEIQKLPSIEELAGMDLPTFTGRKPLARYAQARTVLMWLLERGELGEFYLTYADTYDQDPTGLHAIYTVTGLDGDELDRVYRGWIAGLDQVPETGSDLEATLGISVENGTGDGVAVQALSLQARRRTGLTLGMVITSIEGRATRDLHEMIRVLGSYRAGDVVTVGWRRGTIHGENEIELLAR
ncbi:MAG: TPR end-of-group domain-containing protein [Phycisphaerales bacterium]